MAAKRKPMSMSMSMSEEDPTPPNPLNIRPSGFYGALGQTPENRRFTAAQGSRILEEVEGLAAAFRQRQAEFAQICEQQISAWKKLEEQNNKV